MPQQIFVDLPCRSLPRAKAFYESMGYTFEDLDGHIWELVHMSGMPPAA